MIWVLREMIFAGGKYLVIKASLHLLQESILLRGKEENQNFARSLKEKGNNFNFTILLYTSFFFCLSHNSTNVFRWDTASSSGVPENWSFITRFSKAALISQDFALVAGGAIGVPIKSWDFYIYAPGSLAILIHPHTLNFCSLFPTPLPETLRTGHKRWMSLGQCFDR